MKRFTLLILSLLLAALTGCSLTIDAPQTPTVVLSPTMDETAIARLASPTPAPTRTPSHTPTRTPSPTPTDTSTATDTPTDTPTPTETSTGTATRTASPTATATSTATATPSATPTPTLTRTPRPTLTPTASDTATRPPTRTPEPSATRTATSTFTPTVTDTATRPPTVTITPRPTLTARPTQTATPRRPTAVPSPTPLAPTLTFTPFPAPTLNLTATQIALLATPTPIPATITPLPDGGGTFFDPNASPENAESLPVAPPGEAGPSGPPLPEQQAVIVSYAGQVVPLLALTGGQVPTAPMAEGTVFAVSSTGQVAAVGGNHELFVNGGPLTVSPSSIYGTDPNLSYGDLVWSPDGRYLAFRVDAANPGHDSAINGGIWVYDLGMGQSWQVFRTAYPGRVAQQEEQRAPLTMRWSPNSTALVVTVHTPLGVANVVLDARTDINRTGNPPVPLLKYADATWTTDSSAILVSGEHWDTRQHAIGRYGLDGSYTEYQNQAINGLFMRYAVQTSDGWIAFLGGPSPDAFALYLVPAAPNMTPAPVSAPIGGQIVHAEWNAARTAALVTVSMPTGPQLWIVRTDGATQPITVGGIAAAHWR